MHKSADTAFAELAKNPEMEQFDAKVFGLALLDMCEKLSECCEWEGKSGQDEKTIKAYEIIRTWLTNNMDDELHASAYAVVRPFESILQNIASYKEVQMHMGIDTTSYEKYYLPSQIYLEENDNQSIASPLFVVIGMERDAEGNYKGTIDFNDSSVLIESDKALPLMRAMSIQTNANLPKEISIVGIHNAEVEVAVNQIKMQNAPTKPSLRNAGDPLESTTKLVEEH